VYQIPRSNLSHVPVFALLHHIEMTSVNDDCMMTGAPIIASLPHFYDAAPEYQTGVIGFNPSKEKHEILMVFEPVRHFGLTVPLFDRPRQTSRELTNPLVERNTTRTYTLLK
jgi:hypothetical protein